MHDLSSIHEAAILRGLAPHELEQLGSIARTLDFREGERVFARGERTESLFVTTSGRFALTVVLHVLGVILASVAHRENLVASMLSGTKRAGAAEPSQ